LTLTVELNYYERFAALFLINFAEYREESLNAKSIAIATKKAPVPENV